jgi:hypothetical protein
MVVGRSSRHGSFNTINVKRFETTTFDDDEYDFAEAMRLGAKGYLFAPGHGLAIRSISQDIHLVPDYLKSPNDAYLGSGDCFPANSRNSRLEFEFCV